MLEGFDAGGAPKLRPAKRPITLRHLLTHTAGFSYDVWDGNTARYVKHANIPGRATGKVASIRQPLIFDPGERWEYGINTDWAGRLVEVQSGQLLDAYFKDRIFGPLGMKDSGYAVSPEQRARQARVHARQPDGSLTVTPWESPLAPNPEFVSGGGPLYSTPGDYLTFLRMLLHGGAVNGVRMLKPETVADMNRNHTGNIPCGIMKTQNRALSNDVDLFPGAAIRWGLGYMLNVQAGPNGRSAGTVSWGGLYNTYYWIDPAKRVTGFIMTQILPFADPRALKVYGQFERGVYDALGTDVRAEPISGRHHPWRPRCPGPNPVEAGSVINPRAPRPRRSSSGRDDAGCPAPRRTRDAGRNGRLPRRWRRRRSRAPRPGGSPPRPARVRPRSSPPSPWPCSVRSSAKRARSTAGIASGDPRPIRRASRRGRRGAQRD